MVSDLPKFSHLSAILIVTMSVAAQGDEWKRCQTCLSCATEVRSAYAHTSCILALRLLSHLMAQSNNGQAMFLTLSDYEAFLPSSKLHQM
jgi:hypothetical protein